MKLFSEVKDGEVFVVQGGFVLQKVNESTEYNCVDVEDATIGIKLGDNVETYTEEEFNSFPKQPAEVLQAV